MSRRVAAYVAVVVALAGTGVVGQAYAGGEARTGNWLLLKAVPTGDYSREGWAAALLHEKVSGHGPWLLGMGGADFGGVAVFTELNTRAPVELTTSSRAGGVHFEAPNPSPSLPYTSSFAGGVPSLGPGQAYYLLLFETNVSMHLDRVAHSRGLRVTATMGSGARAIEFAAPDDGGIAAAAGPAGIAVNASHRVRTGAGIVGGLASAPFLVDQPPLWVSWHGPGGARGSDFCDLGCDGKFAGPAGRWTWQWTGLDEDDTQPPAIAAYAPIGPAWKAFRPRR
jgi:hypothetical protein